MATPEKRKAEEPAGGVDAQEDGKRAKLGDHGAPASAPAKPTINLSALEKAKQTLQRTKELLAAKKAQQQAQEAAAAKPPAAEKLAAATTTTPTVQLVLDSSPADGWEESEFFDPELGRRGADRLDRRRRGGLHFVEEGRFQKQAELVRLHAKYGEGAAKQLAARRAAEAAAAEAEPGDANLVPLGERGAPVPPVAPPRPPPPAVEWWDARVLADKTSYGSAAGGGEPVVRLERITALVEHPVQVEPPGEAPLPLPQPLKLTKKELKKLRTQRRLAREQEKQELIRQGLLEPPAPKVRISNLARVLGEEAAADPTAIETEVRRQMEERATAHADRNLARKLTPAEAREKKLKKLVGDPTAEPTTTVSLYKVASLARPQLKFKVSMNAQELHMTGVGLALEDGFTLVIVEGPDKAQRRYEKLMLHRIDWAAADEDDDQDMETEGSEPKPPNSCHLVWKGKVLEPTFRKFRIESMKNAAAAKAFLDQYQAGHYWSLAEAFLPE